MAGDSGRGTRRMLLGAVISAIGAYVYIVIGTRAFETAAFAPIALVWTILFLGATIFFLPLEQLMIREVSRGSAPRQVLKTHLGSIALGVVVPVIAGGVYTMINLEERFAGDSAFVWVVVSMLTLAAAYFLGRGSLAGFRRFTAYGNAVAADAIVRVAVGLIALYLLGTVVAYSIALVVTPLIIWAWRPFTSSREVASAPPAPEGFFGGLVVAQGASQIALASGPILVAVIGAGSVPVDEMNAIVSTLFVTFTLFRGPLTAAYNVTARILPALTEAHEQGELNELARWVRKTGWLGVASAPVLGVAAYLLGPTVVALFYGPGYDPSALMAAYAAAGVGLGIAVLVLTQILVARARTVELARAWLIALLVGGTYLLVRNGAPEIVVSEAFLLSHAVALAGTWRAAR